MRITMLLRIAAPITVAFSTATFAASPSVLLETVDTAGNVGAYTSIAVGSDHVPYIASSSVTTGRVRFASRAGGVWTSEDVTGWGDPTSNRSLRFDVNGQPRIVYDGSTGAWPSNVLATRSSSGWLITPLPTGYANWWTANALDAQGTTRVAYLWSIGSAGGYTGALAVEWEDIAPNVFVPVDPSCALEYDSQGVPHLVATLDSGFPMGYWTKPGFSWLHETLPVGLWPALAIDASDNLHVCYYAIPSADLVYAIRTGPNQWLTEPVDTDGDVGRHPSLVVDSAGRVRVTYYDATHGDLKYALSTGFGSPWTTVTVDGAGDVGQWSSLAIDGEVSHISYYDAVNQDLRYAQIIGSITAVGDSPALSGPSVRALPNPFNPTTTLVYTTPARGRVRVTVYDISGRVVERLVDAERDPGEYRAVYRARTASGVYFARVEAGGRSATTKIVVLK